MKKNNYSAPTMEQVRMEAEMHVMAGSVGPVSRGAKATLGAVANW